MHIFILTLFPEMFAGPFDYSIVKRAKAKGLVTINLVNIRDFAENKYKSVDDHPYGGGVGMVMRVDVIDRALIHAKALCKATPCRIVLLDPKGQAYAQQKAREFSGIENLILICGHYEGVDERVKQLVDESISIGPYILTGGEIPAMTIVDSVVRLIPGVLAHDEATVNESFTKEGALEYPQYTAPAEYKGMKVPQVLLSGNHQLISKWRGDNKKKFSG